MGKDGSLHELLRLAYRRAKVLTSAFRLSRDFTEGRLSESRARDKLPFPRGPVSAPLGSEHLDEDRVLGLLPSLRQVSIRLKCFVEFSDQG